MTLYREMTDDEYDLWRNHGLQLPVRKTDQMMVKVEPIGQVYFHEGKLKPMTFNDAEGYYDCYRRKEGNNE